VSPHGGIVAWEGKGRKMKLRAPVWSTDRGPQ
jgi:hypothetical protein